MSVLAVAAVGALLFERNNGYQMDTDDTPDMSADLAEELAAWEQASLDDLAEWEADIAAWAKVQRRIHRMWCHENPWPEPPAVSGDDVEFLKRTCQTSRACHMTKTTNCDRRWEMKSGFKTSEFWLTVAAAVVGAVVSTGALGDSAWAKVAGVASVALAALGYSVSRGLAKGGGKSGGER